MRQPGEVLIAGSTTLAEILEMHKKWVCDGLMMHDIGRRASIYNAEIFDTDLKNVLLDCADLFGVSFAYSNLQCADLRYANLQCADLRYADLSYTDLTGANLAHSNLTGVNLTGACICNTIFSDAILYNVSGLPDFPYACPDTGSFIGWKRASNKIICLEIPEDAKRVSSTSRKCRCNKAKVLSITEIDGSPSGLVQIPSNFDLDFIYKIGETVKVDDFDEDRWHECAPGIHFFINRIDAVNYYF